MKKFKEADVIDRIQSFLSSVEGKVFLNKEKKKIKKSRRAQKNWNNRFKKRWLKTGRFSEWMKKMIEENGEEHIKSEYEKGHQPSPTLRLFRTFGFARMNASRIGKVLTTKQIHRKFSSKKGPFFNSVGWEIEGYSFIETQGQGTFFEVYNPDNKRIIALG